MRKLGIAVGAMLVLGLVFAASSVGQEAKPRTFGNVCEKSTYKPRQVVLKQEENKTTVVCAGLCPPARICMLRSSSLPQSAYTWDLERDLGLPAGAAPGGYPPPPPPMAPPPGNAPSVPPPPTVH